MLSTCEICRRRDYCDNCAMAEDCYWIKAIPPEGGRQISCESFECKHYGECRKTKAAVSYTHLTLPTTPYV